MGSGCAWARAACAPVFQEAVSYYGKLQEEGQIEWFEAYLLDPHGGDLAGFFLLHGQQSALDAARSSAEFRRVLVRAGSVIDNLGLMSAYSGNALGRQIARFGHMAQELPQANSAAGCVGPIRMLDAAHRSATIARRDPPFLSLPRGGAIARRLP